MKLYATLRWRFLILVVSGLIATHSNAQENDPIQTETIGATVVDENEIPVSNILVRLQSTDGKTFSERARTDLKGKVEFQIPKNIFATLTVESVEHFVGLGVTVNPEELAKQFHLSITNRPASKILVVDSNSQPVDGAIIWCYSSNATINRLTRSDGTCEVIPPDDRLTMTSIYHPTKAESCFFVFSERLNSVDDERTTIELGADHSGRVLFVDSSGEPVSKFFPIVFNFVEIGFPPRASSSVSIDKLCSDKNGVLEIRGLNPGAQYTIQSEIDDKPRRLIVTDLLEQGNLQELTISDGAIEANSEQSKAEFIMRPQEEIAASKWLNSSGLRIRDQTGKIVLLQNINSLSVQDVNCMNDLQWMHKHYSEKGLVACANFSSQLDAKQIEKLAMKNNWQMPICLSNNKVEYSALMYIEPTADHELESTEIFRENALRRIRNLMVHGQKSFGRY